MYKGEEDVNQRKEVIKLVTAIAVDKQQDKQLKTPFEQMSEDLVKIKSALEALQKVGVSKELMEIYIQHKTKVAKYIIRAVLDAQYDFLKNAIKR
jgi:Zn-dependent oligopeptidase